MPFHVRRASLAGGLLLIGVAPGLAAPPAMLGNLVSNVDFLDRSSRFALQNSKNARLRAFARSEAREQSQAIDALYDWTQARLPLDPKALTASTKNLDTTPTGSTKPATSPTTWPLTWPPAPPQKPAPDERLAKGQEDLDSLEGLTGPAFDADYKAAQREALAQVAADYAGYLAPSEPHPQADDPALRAIAQRELPKVRRRLAELERL